MPRVDRAPVLRLPLGMLPRHAVVVKLVCCTRPMTTMTHFPVKSSSTQHSKRHGRGWDSEKKSVMPWQAPALYVHMICIHSAPMCQDDRAVIYLGGCPARALVVQSQPDVVTPLSDTIESKMNIRCGSDKSTAKLHESLCRQKQFCPPFCGSTKDALCESILGLPS